MLRFLTKLMRQFQTVNTARTPHKLFSGREAKLSPSNPQRLLPQVEALESRQLLSASVGFTGGVLSRASAHSGQFG
jgi:hypothetical protein